MITPGVRNRAVVQRSTTLGAVFIGAQVMLGLAVWAIPALALIHSVFVLVAGLVAATVRSRYHTALVVAYIAASEVLWRMSRQTVSHEFAKYATILVVLVSLLRFPPRRNRALAIGYFLLLLPSAYLTFDALELESARQQASFNLSGPLSLAACVLFFSQLRVTPAQIRTLFMVVVGAVLSIASFAMISTLTHDSLEFKNVSNFATSGGFGPNQVAAALGLGLLFVLLLLFERRSSLSSQVPLLTIAAFLAVQATLTFSRGGLGMAIASLGLALLYLVRNARTRITLFIVAVTFSSVGYFVIYPRLEQFTGGKVSERYTNTDSSNRMELAQYDLAIFEDNVLMGVGPGMATPLRAQFGANAIAHTEPTRLLAEHGLLGATALFLLGILGWRTARQTRQLVPKAFVSALLGWTALFLLIDAMRMVAPSTVLGCACMIAYSSRWWPEKK